MVVEEQLARASYKVVGDGFVVDGTLFFRCWADEHFEKLCTGLVPEVIRYATRGVDLISYTVDAALGLDCKNLKMALTEGYWSSYMVHALEDGVFRHLWLSDRAKECIVEQYVWVKPAGEVKQFGGSHYTLGAMIVRYSSMDEMLQMVDNMEQHIRVVADSKTGSFSHENQFAMLLKPRDIKFLSSYEFVFERLLG